MLKAYKGIIPEIHDTAFVEESAQVIGDVSIGRDSSVWFNAVLRGDVHTIRIGECSNIQDGAVLHGTFQKFPVVIEDHITIGHGAIVHGCTVHSNCLIGMRAVILDDADIGENCLIGAGAVVTEGMAVPAGSLVLGMPGRIIRQLHDSEIQELQEQAARYVAYKNAYLAINTGKEV